MINPPAPQLLAAFKSEQLEQMFEKIGNEPPTDKEWLALISGLATDPDKLKDEKSIENLTKETLEDLSKAIQ